MFRKAKYDKTSLRSIDTYVAEPLEKKVAKITANNEPIDNTAPLLYTAKEDGVRPEYDVRTDRWDIALEAMDKVTASMIAKSKDQQQQQQQQQQPESAPADNAA